LKALDYLSLVLSSSLLELEMSVRSSTNTGITEKQEIAAKEIQRVLDNVGRDPVFSLYYFCFFSL
jgi:hypothetical protein